MATRKPTKKAPAKKAATKKSSPADNLAKARAARAAALAKARAAKKGTKTGAKTASASKAKTIVFKAPESFKPHFIEVAIKTEKDGLLGGKLKAIRIYGGYNPKILRDENQEGRKWWDIATFNPEVSAGILSRFAARTFVVNAAYRLPANSSFKILLRVGKKSADNSLNVTIKWVKMLKEIKGKKKFVELDKTDPVARKIKSAKRFLPAAFVNTLEPPVTRGRRSRSKQDDE